MTKRAKVSGGAKTLAGQYQYVVKRDSTLGYVGCSVEFPLVMADGKTAAVCVEQLEEATALAVQAMLDAGEVPPSPSSEEKRDVQVNVRVSGLERLAFESAAKRKGFRSISDFLRAAAMAWTK